MSWILLAAVLADSPVLSQSQENASIVRSVDDHETGTTQTSACELAKWVKRFREKNELIQEIEAAKVREGCSFESVPSRRPLAPHREWRLYSEEDRLTKERLEESVSVDVDKVPLSVLLNDLSVRFDVPIVIDPSAIAHNARLADRPVSAAVSGIRLRSLLSLTLGPESVTYVVKNGAIHVVNEPIYRASTPDFAAEYDVRHIHADNHQIIDALRLVVPGVEFETGLRPKTVAVTTSIAGHERIERQLDLIHAATRTNSP